MPPNILDRVSLLEDVNKNLSDRVQQLEHQIRVTNETLQAMSKILNTTFAGVNLPEIPSKQESLEIQEEVLKPSKSGPYSYRPLKYVYQ